MTNSRWVVTACTVMAKTFGMVTTPNVVAAYFMVTARTVAAATWMVAPARMMSVTLYSFRVTTKQLPHKCRFCCRNDAGFAGGMTVGMAYHSLTVVTNGVIANHWGTRIFQQRTVIVGVASDVTAAES